MHVLLALLLLSCSLSLSRAAVILEDGSPIKWGHTTSQTTDFENFDGKSMPDPWHYLQRMSLYHVLIASTNQYMTSMGPGDKQSPLWGLPLQLGWMFSSARLEDPAQDGQCGHMIQDTRDLCISPNSWYSCVNYFSSVLPYLSAANQGIMGVGHQVQMKAVPGVNIYCTTYDDCRAAYESVMINWDNLFLGLIESIDSQMPDNQKKEEILGRYWTANMASTNASSVCDPLLPLYTAEERAFAESWKIAAEFVAAVNFHSNLEMSYKFMKPLPGHRLKEGDYGDSSDFTAEEKHALSAFSWMKTANYWLTPLGGPLTDLWRSIMCSDERRENGRQMLNSLMTNSSYSFITFGTLVTNMGPCPPSN